MRINKLISVVIIFFLMITTLLSCSKEESVDYYDLTSDNFTLLQDYLIEYGRLIQEEKDFFRDNQSLESYEESGLNTKFNELEDLMADQHEEIGQIIESTKSLKKKGNIDKVIQLESVFDGLINDIINYHYMIQQTSITKYEFSNTINGLADYLSLGHITSIDYNNQLDSLMKDYEDMLSIEAIDVYGEIGIKDIETFIELKKELSQVVSKIKAINVQKEVDEKVNTYVLNMFIGVDEMITIIIDRYNLFMEPGRIKDFSIDPDIYIEATISSSIEMIMREIN